MCPRCEGMGTVNDIDLTQLYDESRSLADGAITIPGYTADGWSVRVFTESGFLDPAKPIRDYSASELDDFLRKDPTKVKFDGINLTYEGLVPKIQKSMLSKDVDAMQPHIRAFVERAVTFQTCPECGGTRLAEHARRSKIDGISIADACSMQITDLATWARAINAPEVSPVLASLTHLLDSFVEIGLGYLSLDRPSGTLSGGEAQRTKMIRHLGSALTDVTYVFDEPTIGLHPHDIQRMNTLLLRLRDKGNTVLVVEHKPEAIVIADHVVDLGPGAGSSGGEVVFEGTVEALRAAEPSPGAIWTTGRGSRRRFARRRAHERDGSRFAQPAKRRREGAAWRAHGHHRCRGKWEELADQRLRVSSGGRGSGGPGRDSRLAALQPGYLHGAARADSQGVRPRERRQARVVQRQLRGRVSRLQRRRRDLHRARLPRHRGVRV